MARDKLGLPEVGQPVSVVIEYFSKRRKWGRTTPLAHTQGVQGVSSNGRVVLAEHALCLKRVEDGDAVLRATVDSVE